MSEMKELKKIGVLSAGKVGGVLYLALGLYYWPPNGLPLLIWKLSLRLCWNQDPNQLGGGLLTGVGALIGYGVCLPIFYGIIGFIGAAISAFIYNVVAGFMGGIEFELADVGSKY